MSENVVVYTSLTYAELPGALTLARTLKARHPAWRLWAVWVDRALPDVGDEPWRRAFDAVIDAAVLYGESWRREVFKHDALEARAAVKGRALARVLAEGADKAFYLSPDIAVFHGLAEVAERLDAASILLTPHQVEANDAPRAIADNEALALRRGVYNLGFLGVRNDAVGAALARWWSARLDEARPDDEVGGRYLDQKYFDLVPGLFDRVELMRDPGCHVGAWNLSRREIVIAADGRILVNGRFPLKFFHFANDDLMTERYAGSRLAPYELWAFYRRALAEAAPPPVDAWGYARYDDGAPIRKAARRMWRDDPDLWPRFADPFAVGPDSFRAFLKANKPELL